MFGSQPESTIKGRYTRTLDRWNTDPNLKKFYDLETIEQIVEKRFPNASWINRQLDRELIAAPKWTAGQQVQLDELKNRIRDWTPEEQNIARGFFWEWTELEKGGRSRAAAKEVIIEMTRRYLDRWLRNVDRLQQEGCRKPSRFC